MGRIPLCESSWFSALAASDWSSEAVYLLTDTNKCTKMRYRKDVAKSMNKLFTPSLFESPLCEPEQTALEAAAMILHSIGWNTQQGMPERGIEVLEDVIRQDQGAVIKACAAAVAVLRRNFGHTST